MRQTLYIFGAVLLFLASYNGGLVAANKQPEKKPVTQPTEQPTWSGFFSDCKKYVTQKVDTVKQDMAKGLELTREDEENIEMLKEGLGQEFNTLNKIVEVGVVSPLKELANGGNTEESLKKQEDKKRLITVKTELLKKTYEELTNKLKPYCPKGTTPEQLPEQLLETAYLDANIKRQKRDSVAYTTKLATEIKELEKTIAASQTLARSGFKTIMLGTGSLICGVSAGALTYLATKKLVFKKCTNKTIKHKREAVKKLVNEHTKLSKRIRMARAALKERELDAKKREKAKNFLRENGPNLKKLKNQIFWGRVTVLTMNLARVGVPIVSIAASCAITAMCVNYWSSIWPATIPPQINTTADQLVKLKNDCDALKTDFGKAKKEYADLERTDKTLTHLPPEIQQAVTELKSISGSLRTLENQAGAKDTRNITTITDVLFKTFLG